ncbi:hypothetical protein R5R35_012309 [Gryllus longicercus]|uniref:J domain-containing protein n=1 Tax=Gryllus longicercus TaxID=2509291 RepID=A0AAN9V4Y9_9ORTH
MLFVCGLFNRKIRFILQRKICLTRCYYETHYEVLQLPRNCTQKEIKTAFIKLSKQYHPDKNANDSTHNKFVKLNEAYTILSRPETRREYDLSLVPDTSGVRRSRNIHYDYSYEEPIKPFRDKSFWENRDRSNDAGNMQKPYYGIKGIKRVSNSWILTCLMLFMLFGVGLQAYLINKSMVFSRKALEDETSRNAEILRRLRQRAQESDGDSAVLERLQRNSDAWRALRGKTTEVKTE